MVAPRCNVIAEPVYCMVSMMFTRPDDEFTHARLTLKAPVYLNWTARVLLGWNDVILYAPSLMGVVARRPWPTRSPLLYTSPP